MGACASVPKGMKKDATAAPAPEPAKEESVKAVESTEEVKTEQEKKNDDEAKLQSLGSLLDKVDVKKEEKAEEKKTSEEGQVKPKEEEQKKPKEEEQKVEVAPATTAAEKTQEIKNSEEKNEVKKEN